MYLANISYVKEIVSDKEFLEEGEEQIVVYAENKNIASEKVKKHMESLLFCGLSYKELTIKICHTIK